MAQKKRTLKKRRQRGGVTNTDMNSMTHREQMKVFKDNLKSLANTPMNNISFKIKFKSMMDQFASL